MLKVSESWFVGGDFFVEDGLSVDRERISLDGDKKEEFDPLGLGDDNTVILGELIGEPLVRKHGEKEDVYAMGNVRDPRFRARYLNVLGRSTADVSDLVRLLMYEPMALSCTRRLLL